ncbi:hypothetical protein ACQKDD_17095 [Planococcus kocurii]|uniref:hypothetical protein n=1 Tax=Planococcus TaxID=1372 RepID=UPI0011F09954|nr:hypothetical protein [Planococcus sp. ANT_H30]KAA0956351.1 hypothetical protein FQ085_12645 [Planococcus sp. ANT_H30]
MKKRLKDAVFIAIMTFIVSFILFFILFGEIRWVSLMGTALGAFIGSYFLLPLLNKRNAHK